MLAGLDGHAGDHSTRGNVLAKVELDPSFAFRCFSLELLGEPFVPTSIVASEYVDEFDFVILNSFGGRDCCVLRHSVNQAIEACAVSIVAPVPGGTFAIYKQVVVPYGRVSCASKEEARSVFVDRRGRR